MSSAGSDGNGKYVPSGVDGSSGTGAGAADRPYDYDWIVIGSGFGGAVSALRLSREGLSRRGDRAGPPLRGSRAAGLDLGSAPLPVGAAVRRTGLPARRPVQGRDGAVRGRRRRRQPRRISSVSLRPPKRFFTDRQWGELEDWESRAGAALRDGGADARRRHGAVRGSGRLGADRGRARHGQAAHEGADRGRTTASPARRSRIPYFGGEGPPRRGCISCGKCLLGCKYNAKNTLPRNYLYLAERRGARILPDRKVTSVPPLAGMEDGSLGYAVSYVGAARQARQAERPRRGVRGGRDRDQRAAARVQGLG